MSNTFKIETFVTYERETSGAVRYFESDSMGRKVEKPNDTLTQLYLRKLALAGCEVPKTLRVIIDCEV